MVCFDEASKQEASKQLVEDPRDPLPPAPGSPAKQDAEYKRNGTANLFMATGPLAGWPPGPATIGLRMYQSCPSRPDRASTYGQAAGGTGKSTSRPTAGGADDRTYRPGGTLGEVFRTTWRSDSRAEAMPRAAVTARPLASTG